MTTTWWNAEVLRGQWRAAQPWGTTNIARVPGKLVLTNYRIIFESSMPSRESRYVLLRDLATVRPVGESPRIRLNSWFGDTRYYTILGRADTTVWSTRNVPARDDAVRHIHAEIVKNHPIRNVPVD
jgi:hypothetical protein